MRRAFLALAVVPLVACVTSEYRATSGPSLSGHLGDVAFDRHSVTNVRTQMSWVDDGWVGRWSCKLNGQPRLFELCPARVSLDEGFLVLWSKTRYPVLTSERGDLVVVQEPWGDTTFRRLDRAPIPAEAIAMLWIALQAALSNEHDGPVMDGQRITVEGLGPVEIHVDQPRALPPFAGDPASPT
jgi:hypothetical protein